jgi:hypothetical protein
MIIQWNNAYGLGGGGGGGAPEGAGPANMGNGIVTYGGVAPQSPPVPQQGGGPINIPLDAANGLPSPTAPAEATPLPQPGPAATELPGGGPILGIPEKREGGQILAPTEEQPQIIPTELPHTDQGVRAPTAGEAAQPTPTQIQAEATQPAELVARSPTQASQPALPFTRILQGALLILAALAAVAAIILRRRA